MLIEIDRKSGTPAYLQIKEQIVALIRAGKLKPGERLPSSRQLSRQLDIARKTVLSAYLELSAEGWIDSRPGSRTFVSETLPGEVLERAIPAWQDVSSHLAGDTDADTDADATPAPPMDWTPYAFKGEGFALPRYYEKWQGEEPYVSFAKALPDPRQFPFGRIKRIASQLLWEPREFFFDYGHPQGYAPLVEYLEEALARERIDMREGTNEVVLVNGFQSGFNLLLTLLYRPDTVLAVENPTYASILNCLIARRLPYVGIPMQADGMDVDYLAGVLTKTKVSAIITIPDLHNPTGAMMSREKRQQLIRLAQQHSVPIIEDAWAFFLRTEAPRLPSLKALDPGGHVFLVGSFSKSFLPGLRLGFICTPADIALSLVKLKRATVQSDSQFLQVLLLSFIQKGYMDLHLRKMARIYRERMAAMEAAMREHLPKNFRWQKPAGGFSFWVEMPQKLLSAPLLLHAVKYGVDFASSNFFYHDKQDSHFIRLAFSMLTQQEIKSGMKRLGRAIKAFKPGEKP